MRRPSIPLGPYFRNTARWARYFCVILLLFSTSYLTGILSAATVQGLSSAPQRASSASRWHKRPETDPFPTQFSDTQPFPLSLRAHQIQNRPLPGASGNSLPYGYSSVMLTVVGALAIVLALRSPIAPAISAGLLPLALGVRSWWYPPGIVFGTVLLALLSLVWKRFDVELPQNSVDESEDEDSIPGVESYWRLLALLILVLAAVFVVKLTNLRFVLFPPLVVIGFEMFIHTRRCPWATRTLNLPVVCMLTAAGGLFSRRHLGVGAVGSVSSMAWGILILRAFDIHVPPALAVALLPQVIDSPTALYPIAVGIGTSLLSGLFVLYNRVLRPHFEY